jgi:hypothetical protein
VFIKRCSMSSPIKRVCDKAIIESNPTLNIRQHWISDANFINCNIMPIVGVDMGLTPMPCQMPHDLSCSLKSTMWIDYFQIMAKHCHNKLR